MMTKQDFIALANVLRVKLRPQTVPAESRDWTRGRKDQFDDTVRMLADHCAASNPRFNRSRWLAYIAGDCGPSGGAVKGRS